MISRLTVVVVVLVAIAGACGGGDPVHDASSCAEMGRWWNEQDTVEYADTEAGSNRGLIDVERGLEAVSTMYEGIVPLGMTRSDGQPMVRNRSSAPRRVASSTGPNHPSTMTSSLDMSTLTG